MRRADPLVEEVVKKLHEILSGSSPREQKARQIADLIRRNGNHRWVGIYDVNDTEISVIAWSGPAAPTYPRFPVERGISGAAVRSRRAVVVNDVSKDSRYLSTLDTTGAEMIVPVVNGSRVVGTIDIESDIVDRFSESDRAFIEEYADAIRPLWS